MEYDLDVQLCYIEHWCKHYNRLLAYTVYNNERFMKHRTPGATKFLNVLQGNDIPSADEWYEAVFLSAIKNHMVKKHLKVGYGCETCVGGNLYVT